jgi:DNA-binding response OmpR family regulator
LGRDSQRSECDGRIGDCYFSAVKKDPSMSSVPIAKQQDVHRPAVLRYLTVDGLSVEVADGEPRAGTPQLSRRDALSFLTMTIQSTKVVEGHRDTLPTGAGAALVLGERTTGRVGIAGLELGAQACVILCTPRELADRIQMMLRCADGVPSEPEAALESGHLKMWRAKRRVEWRGELVKVTSTEFNLLDLLLRNIGRPVSKRELSLYALRRPPARYERSIDAHVCNLRRKLAVFAEGKSIIQSVYPHQYQLIR